MAARSEFDTVIIDEEGNALANVDVTVYDAGTTDESTIFNAKSGGGTKANPIVTDATGFVQFWADPGSYDIAFHDTNIPARIADRTITFESLSGEDDGIPQAKVDGLVTDISQASPPGVIFAYGGGSAPAGFVLCNGASLVRTGTYAALFAVIGTTFGSADGTHFNVPDLRGRVPVGADPTGVHLPVLDAFGLADLGDTGGEEVHELAISEIPAHSHDVDGTSDTGSAGIGTNWIARAHNIVKNLTITSPRVSSVGGGGSHNNVQPYVMTNYIIKY